MAVADTFDALTANRAYHTPVRVAEALHLLKDACGYDFDLTVVVAMTEWARGLARSWLTVVSSSTSALRSDIVTEDAIPADAAAQGRTPRGRQRGRPHRIPAAAVHCPRDTATPAVLREARHPHGGGVSRLVALSARASCSG